MSRPVVGISGYPRVVEIVPAPALLHTANRWFVDSVARAGGTPLVVPMLPQPFASSVVESVGALVLTGGGDVDPACYGAAPDAATRGVDPDRDGWELALARAALEARLPLLAVCRGAQVLNVALGGTLVQHLPHVSEMRHGWADRYGEYVHDVTLDPASRLAATLGVTTVGANSLHHQAVQAGGTGVVVVGRSADGTVEAFEVDGHPEVLAVQWHPELLEHQPVHQRLFRWVVEAAKPT
jgi:gamma-glutamyl-gamma-aminobutyrate hydrolase PuuD